LTRPVRITPLAEADIARAQDWYESQQPGLGIRFVEHVRATIQRIAQNPFQYQIAVENARRARVREFPYAVWYPFWTTKVSSLPASRIGRIPIW
jgi:plasmid stabilization system protein ParE